MGWHRGGPQAAGFRRGDWVYVDPEAGGAPRDLRGLAGVVCAVERGRATVTFRTPDTVWTTEVDLSLLRPERRRRDRTPAQWAPDELAAAS
jgi:hypothetical protein